MEYHHIPYGKKTKNAGTDRANKKGQNKKMKNSRKNKKILAAPFAVAAVFAITTVGAMFTVGNNFVSAVTAGEISSQIDDLQSKKSAYASQAQEMAAKAGSYQAAIEQLQQQQDIIQSQIDDSKAKISTLKGQIDEADAQIKTQGSALASSLQSIYYSGQSNSTLNILMNSNSISDYVDSQSRQSTMQAQMQKTIDSINALKKTIESKKTDIQSQLNLQESQKQQLLASQSVQQNLKDQANNSEAAYNDLVKQSNDQIMKLQSQREALLSAQQPNGGGGRVTSSGACGGGYPFCSSNGYQKDELVNIGSGTRNSYAQECVSYVEWHLARLGIKATGSGNGGEWWRTWSGKRSGTPTPGRSVAVFSSWQAGEVGHVAWVDSVSGGVAHISQYNWDGRGSYSTMDLKISGAAINGGGTFMGFLNF